MSHHANRSFWAGYGELPPEIRRLADRQFELLKQNPSHPSLRFKKTGEYWSVRIGQGYRALAAEVKDGLLWTWIGTHAEYDRILSSGK